MVAGHAGGFTLIEVAVALVVLELGAFAALGLLALAAENLAAAARLEWATGEAVQVADSLSTLGVTGPGEVVRAPWRVRWTPDPSGATRVSVSPAEPVVELWVP